MYGLCLNLSILCGAEGASVPSILRVNVNEASSDGCSWQWSLCRAALPISARSSVHDAAKHLIAPAARPPSGAAHMHELSRSTAISTDTSPLFYFIVASMSLDQTRVPLTSHPASADSQSGGTEVIAVVLVCARVPVLSVISGPVHR